MLWMLYTNIDMVALWIAAQIPIDRFITNNCISVVRLCRTTALFLSHRHNNCQPIEFNEPINFYWQINGRIFFCFHSLLHLISANILLSCRHVQAIYKSNNPAWVDACNEIYERIEDFTIHAAWKTEESKWIFPFISFFFFSIWIFQRSNILTSISGGKLTLE